MQDVNMPGDEPRSIRNIPVPPNRRHVSNSGGPSGGGRRRGRWLWIAAIVIACVFVGMLISTLFVGATVSVYPRQASVTPPSDLTAALDAPVGSLSYQLMTVSQSAQTSAAASGTEQVSVPAQGTVTIYNDYNTHSQELVANTRFQAPNGNIYRIHASVMVPGGVRKADGTLTPGTAQATVYADAPGPSYNLGATKLTIPGFKGGARYTSFWAQTDGISGGFTGTRPGVSQADLQNAQGQMKQQLAQNLPNVASSQLPDGFLAIPGTFFVTYGDVSVTDAGGGNATLTETATATQAIIRESDLANTVAKATVQGYNGEAINFADPSQIQVAVASGTPYTSQSAAISLSLSGSPVLVWQFDTQAIQQALAGKNKSDFETIMKTFAPAVAKATASLRPFWETTFPADPNKISVKTASN